MKVVCFLLLTGCAALAPSRAADEEPPELRYAAMLEAEYGPLGKSTEQILGREKTHEAATVVGALLYRIRGKPPERLSLLEKKLIAVDDLRAEVDNGGFQQYFSNGAADRSALALQGLREMGATQMARVVQRAMSVFPGGKPPAALESRQKAMAAVRRRAEAVWGPCEDEFYLHEEGYSVLALAYAKKYRAQIALP
jgi:hypothetical protein